MRTIKASEFKAKCLQLMEEVAETGEDLVITKHGRPISRLSPLLEQPSSLLGRFEESVSIRGDVLAPVDETWDAES